MKIVIPDKSTVYNNDLDFECFSQFGKVIEYDYSYPDELKERIADADIVITNKCRLNESNLSGSKVKLICLFATGFDNIDINYCASAGITVCNAPDYSTPCVAQHTFALILEFFSKVGEYSKSVSDGKWSYSKTFSYFLSNTHELQGKTLGVIGYGNIGRQVAKIANAFDMNVLVTTRTARQNTENIKFVDLDFLLSNSDIVTVHTPLTDETRNMIDENAFNKMKKTAYLINTSRGAVVDENALYNALISHKIAGAGLDVLSSEPMNKECKLSECDNCIITPHIAWAGKEARERLIEIIVNNIKSYLNGNTINKVN